LIDRSINRSIEEGTASDYCFEAAPRHSLRRPGSSAAQHSAAAKTPSSSRKRQRQRSDSRAVVSFSLLVLWPLAFSASRLNIKAHHPPPHLLVEEECDQDGRQPRSLGAAPLRRARAATPACSPLRHGREPGDSSGRVKQHSLARIERI